jgi:hypothetical protein
MSTALNNNSTRSTVLGTVAISDDEMRRFAPSVFASQPIEGVSERYSFLPTSSILNGMRENGWVPVRAQEQSIPTEARAASRNTWSALLVFSICRPGKEPGPALGRSGEQSR